MSGDSQCLYSVVFNGDISILDISYRYWYNCTIIMLTLEAWNQVLGPCTTQYETVAWVIKRYCIARRRILISGIVYRLCFNLLYQKAIFRILSSCCEKKASTAQQTRIAYNINQPPLYLLRWNKPRPIMLNFFT